MRNQSLLLLAVPLSMLLALLAHADAGRGDYWDKTYSHATSCNGSGVCTGSAPTWDAGYYNDGGCCSQAGFSSGASLRYVDSFRGLLCAPPGQSFTATGTARVYYGDSYSRLSYESPQLHQPVAPDGGGQCVVFPDFKVGAINSQAGDVVDFVPQAVGVTPPDGGPLLERIYLHFERYQK